jgi:alpha-L-fucosidase 2
MATTMDMAIIRELFTGCLHAAKALNADRAFADTVKKAMDKLYPYHIGKYGQLQEWFKDWDDPNDKHRHISHLYGLFPGNQVSLDHTPALAAAARQTLIFRGDLSTGWSMAWKANWWARLQDGNHAWSILKKGLTYISPADKISGNGGGGAYPNLFDAHPPFQIDGNFGASAALVEMLLQSHEGYLHLLPALPDAWAEGRISGIKGRGNFTVTIEWKNKQLQRAIITARTGGNCRIRSNVPVKVLNTAYHAAKGENTNALMYSIEEPGINDSNNRSSALLRNQKLYIIDFETQKGKSYILIPE